MLKENRLISIISIAGTAISIAMIMIVVLVFQIQFANYYPENDRDRMMYVENGTEVRSSDGWNRGAMSAEAVKECFFLFVGTSGSRIGLCSEFETAFHSGKAYV